MDENTKPNAAGSAGGKSLFVSADMLPGDMAKTLSPGAVLEFRVVSGVDDQGQLQIAYNTGGGSGRETMLEGMPDSGGEEESWEAEARKSLGPQEPENEA